MKASVATAFMEDPRLFRGKKILVAGDIALDRTFFCDRAPAGRHAVHAGESIIEVRPRGDDFGMLGAAYNACLLAAAVGAESQLVTITGDDPEASRVGELLAAAGTKAKQVRLPGIQTVSRMRFFVPDGPAGPFRLHLRVDKDPDVAPSYAKAESELCAESFLDWWEREAEDSDAILFSDTGKGFLSRRLLVVLDERIRRASSRRVIQGKRPVKVVVDPKREWEKFAGLKVDLFKPNDVEAARAVNLSRSDWTDEANLKVLAERVARKYGAIFPSMVITLAEHGAALLSVTGRRCSLSRYPAVPVRETGSGIAMHCGDMFASAMTLALCMEDEVARGIPFANYVASLQVSKPVGQKIAASDLTDPLNIHQFRAFGLPARQSNALDIDPEKS
jgi:D-beta-D-heptose 7-phosphate kinase / D-beta-D-heptose 1-phosphate adenosyltransferase